MGTQTGAILDLPPTERAKDAAREMFEGVGREIGVGTEDLEETATAMAARMIDSARHAAIDATREILEDQAPAAGGSIKVFVFGYLLGLSTFLLAFGIAVAALYLGSAR